MIEVLAGSLSVLVMDGISIYFSSLAYVLTFDDVMMLSIYGVDVTFKDS
jgi:hypothetical protein